VIKVDAIIEQEQSIGTDRVNGAQDRAYITGVLRGDASCTPGKMFAIKVFQGLDTLVRDGEDALRIFLAGNIGEKIPGHRYTPDTAPGKVIHQLEPEFARQQIRGVNQGFDYPSSLDRLSDVMDTFD
jgi:hypothetical protein